MREKEPRKETIGRGELFFLWHPGTKETFSGFGLTTLSGNKEFLVGLLVVDLPEKADPAWLEEVEATFGGYWLEELTAAGHRAIACQMQIATDSQPYLQQYSPEKTVALLSFVQPLLADPPRPAFILNWDETAQCWQSGFAPSVYEPPQEIREVFENLGYGCLATETNIGVVHVCHAPDADIEGFRAKPVEYQWQLVKMPTAPLIRLQMTIIDRPSDPFRFESFLNVADAHQARVLGQLANQDELYLAFYGDGLEYRFTKTIKHEKQQWQYLDELVVEAIAYWQAIPSGQRDFDRAKAEFVRQFG